MTTGFRSQQMRATTDRLPRPSQRQNARGIKYFVWIVPALAALILGVQPAAARPQDDVLSAAFKCAAIGDLRIWLDCYYGAAQPQRAVLGLPPVPAAQARLVASPPSANIPAQDMPLRDDIMTSALECNRTATGRDWLTCFYAAAEPARARLGLASGPAAKGPASAPPPSGFGLTPKPKVEKQAQSVSARMAAYAFDKNHFFTVTLDNGEVWQQLAGDDQIADWTKPAASYRVRISRGMFGSYNFRVLKTVGLFKVRRIR